MIRSKSFFWAKAIKGDLLILAICIVVFIPFLFFIKPARVGDGSEYYALSLAWKTTLRPFMTDTSWVEYGHLIDSGQIMYLDPLLRTRFPALSLGTTADFVHFWFYSLCAAVVAVIGTSIGIVIPTHTTFLIVHCCLLTILFVIAWRGFKWKGLAAVSMLTFLSPILWYFDKVHTEFFTYCVTTSAVILFLGKRYIAAAFFLALASTQNISFAAISLFTLGIDTFGAVSFDQVGSKIPINKNRHKRSNSRLTDTAPDILSWGRKKYSGSEVTLLVLTIGAIALQPIYYFFRFGALNPIILNGQAKVGGNLQYALIWLLDPDIGLFPNWPFGIALLILFLFTLRSYRLERWSAYRWLAFVFCYVSVSLISQSSTTNLNSGASLNVARYATWYIGLFFPAALVVVDRLMFSKWFTATVVILVVFGVALSITSFRPMLPENYMRPSPTSLWLQKYMPSVYNPPPEVFAERYGGIWEDPRLWKALAIAGPDCHKLLLINQSLNDESIILGGIGCGFNRVNLSQIIRRHLANGSWGGNGLPVYVRLNDAEFEESRFTPILGNWYAANTGSAITELMSNGWNAPENWGTWSEGKQAILTLPPCAAMERQISAPLAIELEMKGFVAPSHPNVNVSIYIGHDKAWAGILDNNTSIVNIILPPGVCKPNGVFVLKFMIDNPTSPTSLGVWPDERILGIGLQRIRFVASEPVGSEQP